MWLYSHNNGHNWGDSDIVIEQEIWDFFSLFVNNTTELTENNNKKKLSSIFNLLGQKNITTKNTPHFYIYDDGTVEKKIVLD